MKKSTLQLTNFIFITALTTAAITATAQPVMKADSAILSNRVNTLIPNSYQYEPILNQQSQSPTGTFNSGLIFLGEQLDRNISSEERAKPAIATTFADLNDLTETSPFGRLVGEHLMHELQLRGWTVTDIRLTRDVIVNSSGEFSLSRDISRLRQSHPAANVITGTYSNTNDGVLLNIRVLDLASGRVVSTAQTRFLKDKFISSMIDKPKAAPTVFISK